MSKKYIKNLETGKIELHFEKSEYLALTAEQKADLKRHYLWSKLASAWVSRSINHQYQAIEIAKKLGFTEEERQGERLSYAEQLERKAEKAEHRAERYDQYSDNAEKRGKALQAELESHRGDIAFFTQPIIVGHSGSQSFGNRRQKIFDRYFKGFEEYRKSEYFTERAETARRTANKEQLKDPVYLDNRIKESNATIKKLEKNIVYYEEILYKKNNNDSSLSSFYNDKSVEQIETWLNDTLDKLEWEIDKQAYLQNCMDEVAKIRKEEGRKLYTKNDIKIGYLIKVRRSWAKVIKVNPKTVKGDYLETHLKGCFCLFSYAEIQDMKIPEDWKEENQKIENPFNVGDIVTMNYIGSDKVSRAFQIIKKTNKTVTIQRIAVEDHKPIKDKFISDKQERKAVKKDRSGNIVVNDTDWYLYKYIA